MAEVSFDYPVAAAVRTEKDFSRALKSDVEIIFLLHANIMKIVQSINEVHEVGKKAIVHIDFAEGVGKDRSGIEYLAAHGADGICTTKTGLVKMAKDLDLVTVQRFFMIDSHSVGTSLDSIRVSKPDVVEIMPSIATKKIREFASLVNVPVIAGGLAETEDEVKAALAAGASMVSTSSIRLWNMKF
jgi:glycerol uptake operon antiterminator